MTYYLRADCLYTGISSGLGYEYGKPLPFLVYRKCRAVAREPRNVLKFKCLISLTSVIIRPKLVIFIAIRVSICVFVFCLVICLSACLSVCLHISKPHVPISPNCMLPVAVAWSSSDGNAIRHILPVLWMTSLLHNGVNGSESKTTRMFRPVRQAAAQGAKFAASDGILLCTNL